MVKEINAKELLPAVGKMVRGTVVEIEMLKVYDTKARMIEKFYNILKQNVKDLPRQGNNYSGYLSRIVKWRDAISKLINREVGPYYYRVKFLKVVDYEPGSVLTIAVDVETTRPKDKAVA